MENHRKKILLVDDDTLILEVIEMALSYHGYEVITAHDGLEALKLIERDCPDLIVIDLIMPKRSGIAVIQQIRKHPIQKPHVIMVSASSDKKTTSVAIECGADLFIPKPFDIDELLSEVDLALSA